jgi:hypothetical protein
VSEWTILGIVAVFGVVVLASLLLVWRVLSSVMRLNELYADQITLVAEDNQKWLEYRRSLVRAEDKDKVAQRKVWQEQTRSMPPANAVLPVLTPVPTQPENIELPSHGAYPSEG